VLLFQGRQTSIFYFVGPKKDMDDSRKYKSRSRTPLRERAGLPPLTPPNSNNTPVESAKGVFRVDPKTGRAGYKTQYFFPVNLAPNFMERKPTMKKMRNRLRAAATTTRRVPRNALFEPAPKPRGSRRRSPNSSPNFFENIKHLFKNTAKK
jgi:hypothetical protein